MLSIKKGEWRTTWVKSGDTGRKFKAVFKCEACGKISADATNYCPHCGDAKTGHHFGKPAMIGQQHAVDLINNMLDIDGFRDGDAVSRRAVIALIESMPDERGTDETDKCR